MCLITLKQSLNDELNDDIHHAILEFLEEEEENSIGGNSLDGDKRTFFTEFCICFEHVNF